MTARTYLKLFSAFLHDRATTDEIHSAIKRLLSSLIADPIKLDAVRSHSVVHPLGFARIVLFERERSEIGVRLNIWRNAGAEATADTNIHCHPWKMRSVVISGKIMNETFRECNSNCYERIICRTGGNRQHFFEPAGTCGLSLVERDSLQRGSSYSLPARVPHRSYSIHDAITLMVRGPYVSNSSSIYMSKRKRQPYNINNERTLRPITTRKFTRIVTSALDKITS